MLYSASNQIHRPGLASCSRYTWRLGTDASLRHAVCPAIYLAFEDYKNIYAVASNPTIPYAPAGFSEE